mmetsp:Transcript_9428/g.12993  ORF Transcript_9428/g.12993 Transcript_9428/m.12993 type:complete len:201 (+) Transcript_9428:223-825(+)
MSGSLGATTVRRLFSIDKILAGLCAKVTLTRELNSDPLIQTSVSESAGPSLGCSARTVGARSSVFFIFGTFAWTEKGWDTICSTKDSSNSVEYETVKTSRNLLGPLLPRIVNSNSAMLRSSSGLVFPSVHSRRFGMYFTEFSVLTPSATANSTVTDPDVIFGNFSFSCSANTSLEQTTRGFGVTYLFSLAYDLLCVGSGC